MSGFAKLSKARAKEFLKASRPKDLKSADHFLLEGPNLFTSFLESGLTAQWILITESFVTKHPGLSNKLQSSFEQITFQVDPRTLKNFSATEHAQGLVACVRKPDNPCSVKDLTRPVLLLDRIGDPGNMGTIIRTAHWFGIEHIFAGKGSVAVYNSKVVRSTAGSIFAMPCSEEIDLMATVRELKTHGYLIVGTDLSYGSSVGDLPKKNKFALLLGSEPSGLSTDLTSISDTLIKVHSIGTCDSLNVSVACGILLFEMTRNSDLPSTK